MNQFEPWDNHDYDDALGIDDYDDYGNDTRRKNKRRVVIVIVSLVSLIACAFVLVIRSSLSTVAPATVAPEAVVPTTVAPTRIVSTTESNVTEIVVIHTAPPGPPPEGVDIGLTAPDFTLKTIDGDSITLSSLKGKAVLLNFWATWCPYCREEMPAFQNVYEELKDDGFIVISITREAGSELGNVIAFRDDHDITFPILLDEEGAVSSRYYVSELPRTLLISPEGVIHKILLGGPITEDEIKRQLSAMQP